MKLLLKDKRVDITDKNNEAIKNLAYNGYFEILEILLKDDRINPSDENNQVIIQASLYDNRDTIKLLCNV